MKYCKQFGIILVISLIGEGLSALIPLPIPASIYGLVLMLLCLWLRVFPLSSVKETAAFLVEIMPVMFIPSAAGLIEQAGLLRENALAYIAITVVSTFVVMLVAGRVTQAVRRRDAKRKEAE